MFQTMFNVINLQKIEGLDGVWPHQLIQAMKV
jgi:hypothetical protein